MSNKKDSPESSFLSKIYLIIKPAHILFFIISILFVVFMTLLIIKGLFKVGSSVNALSIMGTLAQSQAAILAIIVSLTLVAVQLASQRYSPRIISIFSKDRALLLLLGFYGISIIYDITVMWVITDNSPISLFVYLGITLMIMTFTCLFVYIKRVMDILEPNNIVKLLSEEIEPIKIEKFLDDVENIEKNPLITISDIIGASIILNDQITIVNGLKGLKIIFTKSLDHIDKIGDEEKFGQFSFYFREYFIEISLNCIEKRLFDASIYSITSMADMCIEIASLNSSNKLAAGDFIDGLSVVDSGIVKFLQEEGFKGNRASQKTIKLITSTLNQIGVMTSFAIKNKLDPTISEFVIEFLDEKGIEASKSTHSEFKSFSDVYDKDHKFKGPYRLHETIKVLIKINKQIVDSLPFLDQTQFERGVVFDPNLSLIHLLQSLNDITQLLTKYGSAAVRNKYDFILEEISKSLLSNMACLIRKNYDLIVYPDDNPNKSLVESLCSILTSESRTYNKFLLDKVMMSLKYQINFLIQKKSSSFEYFILALFKLYKFNVNYLRGNPKGIGGPTGILKKAPQVIGKIGLACVDAEYYGGFTYLISSQYLKEIVQFIPPNRLWDNFVKTLLEYLIAWGLELDKKEKHEILDQWTKILMEIDEILSQKIWSKLILDILDEIKTSEEFKNVYTMKSVYDPTLQMENNQPIFLKLKDKDLESLSNLKKNYLKNKKI